MKRIVSFILWAISYIGAMGVNPSPEQILKSLEQANTSYYNGDYQNALQLLKQALDNPESFISGGLKLLDKVNLNSMVGRCYVNISDYSNGLSYLLRADSLRTELKLLFDSEATMDAKQTALCYFNLGDIEKGDEWGNRYARLLQKTGGLFNLTNTAKAWLFLYRMHLINGNSERALVYAKKCLRDAFTDDDSFTELFNSEEDMVDFIYQVCFLMYSINDISNALELASNFEPIVALELPGSLYHLRFCNLLTTMNVNSPEVANKYLDKALDIVAEMEETGEFNNDMLSTINNLSWFMIDVNPEIALKTYEYFLHKCHNSGNERSIIYAIGLNGYANLKGFNSQETPEMFKEAFHILAGFDTSDITNIITIGLNWIISLSANEQNAAYIPSATIEVTKELNRRLIKAFNSLSEDKRNLYWQQISIWYQTIVPEIAYSCNTKEMWKLLYDCLLETRGILLSSSISLATVIKESDDSELKAIYAQFADISSNGDFSNLSEALEARLMTESKKYNDFMTPFMADSEKVAAQLKDKEIAIEFVKYDYNAFDNILDIESMYYEPDIRYLALVLDSSSSIPQAIELCSESRLSDGSLHNLYECIWSPLELKLDNVERIYFSPDGALFSLPVEYALMPDGSFIWERYDCHRLSSTRELVRHSLKKAKRDNKGMVLFGGMEYDMSVQDMILDADKYRDVTEEMAKERGKRGELHNTRPLPGSLLESKQIQHIAKKYLKNGNMVQLFKEKEATEVAFKSISGQRKNMIHIATHGFYNGPAPDDMADFNINSTEGTENAAVQAEIKMMRHSGLLFSGVDNVRFDEPIPDDVEDGILDSYEISTLDLHGTDLVTLSACQTGLGQVSGDGVFGLQRGFKKAGVDSIMMSLWNVDDNDTCLFMTEFYRNLLDPKSGSTGDKHTSLRKAQEAVMAHPEWKDEKFWAGFILLDALQ